MCAPPKNDYLDMTLDPTGTLTVGSRRHYTCHKGLVPSGPIEIACIDVNGIPQWDGPIHSCIGNSYTATHLYKEMSNSMWTLNDILSVTDIK